MAAPPKRVYARYPCRLAARVSTGKGVVAGMVLNFGMGGAFVQVQGQLPHTPLRIEISSDLDVFAFEARIVRIAGRDPYDPNLYLYGLYFLSPGRAEPKARLLLDRIRHGVQ